MSGQPENQTRSAVSVRIPNEQKEAMINIAEQRSTYRDRVPISEILREFVEEGLAKRWENLSEETRDALDDDLKANAGGDADAPESLKGESS